MSFNKTFVRGLITLLPIALTIYIVYSAVSILENFLGSVLRWFLTDAWYIPGLGFILTLVLIYSFGLILNNFLAARLMANIERRFMQLPFIRAVYAPLKDLMNLFSKNSHQGLRSVVLVKVGDLQALGIVTREEFHDLKHTIKLEGVVTVYMPFSYALGGYTLVVPKTHLTPIDIPIERAMNMAITGWLKSDAAKTEN